MEGIRRRSQWACHEEISAIISTKRNKEEFEYSESSSVTAEMTLLTLPAGLPITSRSSLETTQSFEMLMRWTLGLSTSIRY